MSLWMNLTVSLNKDSKVSVRRAAEAIWGKHEMFVSRTEHSWVGTFYEVRLCRCGAGELDRLKKFLSTMKEYDPNCNVSIEVNNLHLY